MKTEFCADTGAIVRAWDVFTGIAHPPGEGGPKTGLGTPRIPTSGQLPGGAGRLPDTRNANRLG